MRVEGVTDAPVLVRFSCGFGAMSLASANLVKTTKTVASGARPGGLTARNLCASCFMLARLTKQIRRKSFTTSQKTGGWERTHPVMDDEGEKPTANAV